jgi:large subunit ribosomal protein L4
MTKVSVYNMDGKQIEELELNDGIFGVEVNTHLMHMSVVQQLANKRQGTQSALNACRSKRWRKKTMETKRYR